jgi:hypothetical protein
MRSGGVSSLRQFADARRQRAAIERCDLCGADIQTAHGHVVNIRERALMCVCRPCYLLFTHDGAGGGRFRAVPDRYVSLSGSVIAREDWDALQVPVGLAFFFRSSAHDRVVGFYPSPAGATESELALDAWSGVVRAAPALESMAADVEALLVNRRHESVDAFIVPIDVCYALVGQIRRDWRGFQGGDELWRGVAEFFSRVASRAGVNE